MITRGLMEGLTALTLLCSCTSRDLLYCDESTTCAAGQRCNLATRTCEPAAGDATPPDGGVEARPLRPPGSPCQTPAQCAGGFCVDGVCCDSACEGACRSCALPGKEGYCSLAPDGFADDYCAGAGGSCAGTCKEGACVFPSQVPCGDPVCTGGALETFGCDGRGNCQPATAGCGGYGCASSTACKTSCSAPGDCVAGFQCVDGSCASDLPLGAPCGTNPKACASGYCVDGVCCDKSACPACQACNLNGKGSCSAVADGTACGAATCSGGTKQVKSCKAGACTTTSQSCGLYTCNTGGTDCLTACSGGTGCSGTAYCEATTCKPKKPNGMSCGSALECTSGICTAAEKVCCDTPCAGECETCAGKSTCSPRPVGTPCGDQKLTCVNQPASSTINQPRCDAVKACVPTVVQTCTPYRCQASATPTCGTSCSAHAQCTTLCDLFDKLNTCRPASEVCFADVKSCPGAGVGTQTSPHCAIQSCLDSLKPYVAVADGKYIENLTTKGSTQIISTGTTGPLWNGTAYQARVAIEGKAADKNILYVGPGHKLFGYGLELGPSNQWPVMQASSAQPTLRTCRLHDAKLGACVSATGSSFKLEDVVMELCAGYAIDVEGTDVSLIGAGLYLSGGGIRVDDGLLFMRDATVRHNGAGIQTYKAYLDLDRVRVHDNVFGAGDGLRLENNTTGKVVNLAVYANPGRGIYFYYNPSPPKFINVTVTKNGGLEVEGDSHAFDPKVFTYFYNSILWDSEGSGRATGPVKCEHCDVAWEGNIFCYPPGSCTWFSQDPVFAGASAPEPFALHPTSPCVDAGDDSVSGLPGLDLLKKPRQHDWVAGGAMVDLGAFELQP